MSSARTSRPRKRRAPPRDGARDPGGHVVGFFRDALTHTKAEWRGQPFALLPWQATFVRTLFGTRRPDGLRQYRRAFLEIGRRNGKTSLCAGLALYLLLADNEPGAEIVSVASNFDQATLMFNMAKQMVEASPDLRQVVAVLRHELRVPATGSSYKVIPADGAGQYGRDLHGVLIDELHVVEREVWDALVTGVGARRQPLVLAITTAGYDRSSLAWEQHEYARGVRDGLIDDPEFLPAIYAAEPEDDWTAPATWAKANPSLGFTIKRDYLETECKRAQQIVGAQNAFRRLHLCQWVEQADRWLDLAVWDRGAVAVPDDEGLAGQPCWGGLDLAATNDLTAFVLVWRRAAGGYWVRPWFWLPGEGLGERARKDRVPYDVWHQQGLLTVTEGNVTDYDVIREDLRALAERYAIREIAFDRWNSTQLVTQLRADGATMVAMGQSIPSLAAPTREVERLVLEGSLAHGGTPILRWMVGNVAVEQDSAGNRKPSKGKSRERIDGVVALVMALGRAMVHTPEPEGASAYADGRGLLLV